MVVLFETACSDQDEDDEKEERPNDLTNLITTQIIKHK